MPMKGVESYVDVRFWHFVTVLRLTSLAAYEKKSAKVYQIPADNE
jgi:hypothetical protein